ncbi:MAG: tRNA (N(6)-L-threonylcarbamoyladenosine(37)-C(2))-methylthiotransferase MtaB, partial [Acidobacteriota bacterium]|nr:tRNA (N(6)-L-threonylcarbamoyladenosine(37)-C(2))-methylthiotransferase MtaB [Acidobacteriota bacterium]
DGAALENQLLQRGYTPSAKAEADIVVVNTCTVTAAADVQAREAIRKISAQNQAVRILVTGCYAQRAPDELAELPGVAWVVGNSHKPEIPGIVDKFFNVPQAPNFVPLASLSTDSQASIFSGNIFEQSALLSAPVLGGEGNHTRPTLKIQDGCNLRCSYCVIPFVRGKSRSLPAQTVLQEITKLSRSGFREVVLSGINLGTYGRDLAPRIAFQDLLHRILEETPIERLRISSIEPMDVTADLVKFFAANNRVAQHFHMPLQSGADRVLAAMHRWYRVEHYSRRVELIREFLPHAAIGADVIVGFPGESDEEHQATLSFIENLPFTYLHVFSFSSRPGTRAAGLPGQNLADTVRRRAREIRALGEKKSAVFRKAQIGRQLSVLTLRSKNDDLHGLEVDEPDATSTELGGRSFTPALSSNYVRVRIAGRYLANQWINVRVISEDGSCLVGEPEQPTSQKLPAPLPDLQCA